MPLTDPTLGTNVDQYSALLTTTLQNFQRQMVDNFSDATPFLWWMTQNERKRHLAGGTNIEVPLMYAGANVQAFSGFDDLDTEPVEGMVPATFLWKLYQVPVVISKDHETNNMSDSQIINLVEAKVRQAEISFRETLNFDLINNGLSGAAEDSGTVPDVLRVIGLTDICQNATQGREYGGIDASVAAQSWWVNTFADLLVDFAAGAGTFANDGITAMRQVYLNCSRGNDAPDLILGAQNAFEQYDSVLVDQKRFVNTMAADAGFDSLMYRGSTFLFDRDVPADLIFFLNSQYLTLFVHPQVDMASSPFREAERQWARFSRIYWKGAMVCSNRVRQGLLTEVDDF